MKTLKQWKENQFPNQNQTNNLATNPQMITLMSKMEAFYHKWGNDTSDIRGQKEKWKHDGWCSGFNAALEMIEQETGIKFRGLDR